MRIAVPLTFVLALAAAPAAAQEPPKPAQPLPAPPPPTGIELLLTGSLLTAGGAAVLVTTPWCTTRAQAHTCEGLSGAIGGSMFAAGVPMLVIGAMRWRAFENWALTPTRTGASLTWRTSW